MPTVRTTEVLVIIDMQPYFEASKRRETLHEVLRQIGIAKENKEKIVVLEYELEGETHINIRRKLKDYPYDILQKSVDSGASVLIPHLSKWCKKREDKVILKVCGVNTGACVFRTVRDMSACKLVKQIKIIWSACNDPWGTRPTVFDQFRNCIVV